MKEQILAVQRMQDYIEKHIQQDIKILDLARVAYFSPWYSRRLFIEWTGYTPADYIRRLKLSKSALRLRDEGIRVIDVAMDMGYESVDGYQRAFFKEFGCNPKEYSLNPVPISLFIPYGVKYRYQKRSEKKMENVKNVFIQKVEKPACKVLIKRGKKAENYYEYCEEVGCDVWGILKSIKSISGEPVCFWLPEKYIKKGTSKYVQGVEVSLDYDGVIPEGFDVIELPERECLMFCGEPFAEEDYESAIYEIWEAEKKYNVSNIGYVWDDLNPRVQLEPIGKRGYIELMPIRKK